MKLTYLHKGQQATATAKLVTREWKNADPNAILNLDIGDTPVRLNQFLSRLAKGGAPVAIQNRLMLVGPHGSTIVSDVEKTLESIAQELENTLKNRVGPEIMDFCEKSARSSPAGHRRRRKKY